jgi:hypothetical protein
MAWSRLDFDAFTGFECGGSFTSLVNVSTSGTVAYENGPARSGQFSLSLAAGSSITFNALGQLASDPCFHQVSVLLNNASAHLEIKVGASDDTSTNYVLSIKPTEIEFSDADGTQLFIDSTVNLSINKWHDVFVWIESYLTNEAWEVWIDRELVDSGTGANFDVDGFNGRDLILESVTGGATLYVDNWVSHQNDDFPTSSEERWIKKPHIERWGSDTVGATADWSDATSQSSALDTGNFGNWSARPIDANEGGFQSQTALNYLGLVCDTSSGGSLLQEYVEVDATWSPGQGVFSSDGARFIYCNSDNESISQVSLSTAYDLETRGSVTSWNPTQTGATIRGFCFGDDGSKLYIRANDGTETVYQYSCSSAYDISTTPTYDNKSKSGFDAGTSAVDQGFKPLFNADGTALFLNDSAGIHKYSVSTAWDISTAGTTSTQTLDTTPDADGFDFYRNGNLLVVVQDGGLIRGYHCADGAYDIGTNCTAPGEAQTYADENFQWCSIRGSRLLAGDPSANRIGLYQIPVSPFAPDSEPICSGGPNGNPWCDGDGSTPPARLIINALIHKGTVTTGTFQIVLGKWDGSTSPTVQGASIGTNYSAGQALYPLGLVDRTEYAAYGIKTVDGSADVLHEAVALMALMDLPTVPEYELEGYRWRDDDGSESGATWHETQDTDTTQPAETNVRLRTLIDVTNDPESNQVTLQYRKVGETEWNTIE